MKAILKPQKDEGNEKWGVRSCEVHKKWQLKGFAKENRY